MKVLYLHQYFNTRTSPGGTRSYEVARRLVAQGHEVDMITSDRTSGQRPIGSWYETLESGIRVHWLVNPYDNKMTYSQRVVSFARFAFLSARRATRIRADVVFATSTPLTIALPALWASLRRHIPMVFEVRDLWPAVPIAVGALRNPLLKAAARLLEYVAYRASDHVIALSPHMKEGIIDAGYPPHKISMIPNACDLDLFDIPRDQGLELRRRHAWLSGRPLVLYAGTFGRANGLGYLADLAAASLIRDPKVCFVAIGDGKEKPEVLAKAAGSGTLSRNFFVLDAVPKREIVQWFSAADVVASLFINIPELRATSPNKVFDAWAAGKPVVINHEGWLAETLRDTGAGLVLDPLDVQAASAQLLKSLSDEPWMSSARDAARRLAEGRFSRDALARQVEDVLLRAASRR